MAIDLLSVLDAGEQLTLPERAVLLAEHAPGPGRVHLEPVGRTTELLLGLLEQLGGPTLEATAECRGCGATAEFALDLGDLASMAPGRGAAWGDVEGVRWRPVSYDDLIVAARAADAAGGVQAVLERCVAGAAGGAGDIDADLRGRLSEAMAQADPLAEIDIELTCPDCEAEVPTTLDVVEFTWAHVVAQAQTLLLEVDALARAYSWSETEILALPPARRRRYVDLVAGEA